MTAASIPAGRFATPKRLATRNPITAYPLAAVASRVEARVEGLRRTIHNFATKGIAQEIATAMGWRIERRGREISGVEKLSFAEISAEIEVHLSHGRQEAVDQIVAAMLDGLRSASVPVTAATTIQFYDRDGQRFLRFDR